MSGFLLPLSPVFGLAANVLVMAALLRTRPAAGLLRSEAAGFCAGILATATVAGIGVHAAPAPSGDGWRSLVALSTYGALAYCHFHFVNLGETARRIRLLRELHEAGGKLSHDALLARYGAREIVGRRLSRLAGTGQLRLVDGRYHVGRRTVLRIASGMSFLKRLLLGREGEHGV